MLGWGLTIGDGWVPLLEQLCANLSIVIAGLAEFRALQVKEKLGGLRFYVRGGNERTWALIEASVHASQQICEGCGAPSEVRSQGGWLTTLCNACLDRHNREIGK